jgi:hypothetical protein
MRILVPLALLAALLVPVSSIGMTAPRLSVADASPLTVKGAGFAARERVRVSASLPGATAHWARTSATGSFTVQFTAMTVDSCTAYIVRASGLRGDSATLRVRPPECPQPISP